MGSGGRGWLRSPGCHRPGTQAAPGRILDAFILGFARFQVGSMTSSMFTPRTLSTPVTPNQPQPPGPLDCSEVQLHGDPLVDYLGGHGPATGVRGGIPGHGLLSSNSEQRLRRADPRKGSEMAQGCSSPSGSDAGVGEAADVALIPSVHPGLRFPDGDPPGAPHVLRQLAHREHSRRLCAGEAQCRCGDLGPGSAEEPRARQGTDPLPPPAVEITDGGPDGDKDQTEGEGEASPTVPSGSAPSTRSWSLVEQGPEDTPVKAKDLFPTTRTSPFVLLRRSNAQATPARPESTC